MIRHAPSEIALSAADIDLAMQRKTAKKRRNEQHSQHQPSQAHRIKDFRRSAIHQAIEIRPDSRNARIFGPMTNVRRYVSMPPSLANPLWSPGDPQKSPVPSPPQASEQQSDDRALHAAARTHLPESSTENETNNETPGLPDPNRAVSSGHRLLIQHQPVMDAPSTRQSRTMRYMTSTTTSNRGLWPS